MKQDFWHDRWRSGEIAFHEENGNSLLDAHIHLINDTNLRAFVPLCGKSSDLITLSSDAGVGEVIGCELDERAVQAFFRENNMTPGVTTESSNGVLKKYQADNITIYQGDFFALRDHHLGEIDFVYDRAALVALPPEMRAGYAAHLWDITDGAKQLLITYEYEPRETMKGPPFSVKREELETLYEDAMVEELERRAISGKLTSRTQGFEVLWEILGDDGGFLDDM